MIASRYRHWEGRIPLGPIWVFPKIVVPQSGWFIIENPIKMDDLGVTLFLETSIYPPPDFLQRVIDIKRGFHPVELLRHETSGPNASDSHHGVPRWRVDLLMFLRTFSKTSGKWMEIWIWFRKTISKGSKFKFRYKSNLDLARSNSFPPPHQSPMSPFLEDSPSCGSLRMPGSNLFKLGNKSYTTRHWKASYRWARKATSEFTKSPTNSFGLLPTKEFHQPRLKVT